MAASSHQRSDPRREAAPCLTELAGRCSPKDASLGGCVDAVRPLAAQVGSKCSKNLDSHIRTSLAVLLKTWSPHGVWCHSTWPSSTPSTRQYLHDIKVNGEVLARVAIPQRAPSIHITIVAHYSVLLLARTYMQVTLPSSGHATYRVLDAKG